ncbi:streptomycin adenylyltransferase [Enterococcus faecalis 13-SD-W-01]|nr:streptomycin adenylyltransferase [Enterococcus faecalis 13-SD-W-01]
MRTEEEMTALILKVAKSLNVKAAAISGSRMDPEATKDQFQDYDIVYIVENLNELLADRRWIDQFGERMIMQTPEEMLLFPPTLGQRFTFLMQFMDGTRIDLMLCPLMAAKELEREPLLTPIYDPDGLFEQLSIPSSKVFWVQKPNEKLFQDSCNEFWWVSTYVVKGIARQELIYATDHLYENCFAELLRMLSWGVGEQYGYQISTGKNYKYLTKFLKPEITERLLALLDFSSLEKCAHALQGCQELFSQTAQAYAAERGFFYDKDTEKKVRQNTKNNLEVK